MRYLFFIFFTLLLQSCSPSLQKGGWFVVALCAGFGCFFTVRAIQKSLNLEISIFKVQQSLFALIGFIAAIGFYIWMNSAK